MFEDGGDRLRPTEIPTMWIRGEGRHGQRRRGQMRPAGGAKSRRSDYGDAAGGICWKNEDEYQ